MRLSEFILAEMETILAQWEVFAGSAIAGRHTHAAAGTASQFFSQSQMTFSGINAVRSFASISRVLLHDLWLK